MKTLRFRIEPTSEQRKAIDHEIEANRLVYNCFVTACKLFHRKNGKLSTVFDLNKLGRGSGTTAPSYPRPTPQH